MSAVSKSVIRLMETRPDRAAASICVRKPSMPSPAVIGVDIGTSSSKGVLVDLDGQVLASSVIEHAVQRPGPGHVEMDGSVWWDEFVAIARRLLAEQRRRRPGGRRQRHGPVRAAHRRGRRAAAPGDPLRRRHPVRPPDRAAERPLRGRGDPAPRGLACCPRRPPGPRWRGSPTHEPELFARARRLYMPSSFLARRLTGAYVLDHHSASQCTPLYDWVAQVWYEPWADEIAGAIELPPLHWPGDAAGTVSAGRRRGDGAARGHPGHHRHDRRLVGGAQRRRPGRRRPDADVRHDDVPHPHGAGAAHEPGAVGHRRRAAPGPATSRAGWPPPGRSRAGCASSSARPTTASCSSWPPAPASAPTAC